MSDARVERTLAGRWADTPGVIVAAARRMQTFHVTILEPFRLRTGRAPARRELHMSVAARSDGEAVAIARRRWRHWFDSDVPAHARLDCQAGPDRQAKTQALRYAALRHAVAVGGRPRLVSAERAAATHSVRRRVYKAVGVERDWRGQDRRRFSGAEAVYIRPSRLLHRL